MGAKTYALKIRLASGEFVYVIKTKGVHLSAETESAINFDNMRAIVQSVQIDNQHPITHTVKQTMILKSRQFDVVTTSRQKVFRATAENKRFYLPGSPLLFPFGYLDCFQALR